MNSHYREREEENVIGRREFLGQIGRYSLFGASLLGLPLAGCAKPEKPRKGNPKEIQKSLGHLSDPEEGRIRDAVLAYLTQPDFASSDFCGQVTGTKAEFELYNIDEGMLYFTVPPKQFSDRTLESLTLDTKEVEFGTTEDGKFNGGRLSLGGYSLRSQDRYLFRFPKKDFKVDRNAVMTVDFGETQYAFSMTELADLVDRNIYGGSQLALMGTDSLGVLKVIANHGRYVAKRGEPSLTRLASQISGRARTKEEASQLLLDFVTTEITYDFNSLNSDREVLQRPNEVLMLKTADCSGKAILYSSLLEQTGINYYIFYIRLEKGKGHITVAVEGEFDNSNGLGFVIGGKNFSIAETTNAGFKIGKTRLQKKISLDTIKYYQKPGSDIIDNKTGKPLEWGPTEI